MNSDDILINKTDLRSLIEREPPERIIKALQVTLGYSSNTKIPTIDEFIEDDYYLGASTNNGKGIYPYWREKLRDIFPNSLYTRYDTIFLRSAIGSGKTSIARIMLLYVMCKMMLMEDPHKFFKLLPNKDLVVYLYSSSLATIDNAMYLPLIDIIEMSPFFKSNRQYYDGEYHFTNKIKILTGSSISRNVGLDIFLVFGDELQVEKSNTHSYNYDNYNSLKARIKSRFMLDGGVFFNTLMILSGSSGVSDSFVEKLTEQQRLSKLNGSNDRTIIYNTPIWEVMKGKINYSGETFPVFVGDENSEPQILADDYNPSFVDESSVIHVPIEYRKEFDDDLLISIRDLAGIVTRSALSYITNVSLWEKCFCLPNKLFLIDVIRLPFYDNSQVSDFLADKIHPIKELLFNPEKDRYLHIDLGISRDLTGISMVHINDIVNGEPWYFVDFSIGISRPNSEETSITKIKNFILFLKTQGINIKQITVDGYQSTQLRQELTLAHLPISQSSVISDYNSECFDITRNAIYQGRLSIPRRLNNDSSTICLYNEVLRFKKNINRKGTYKIYYDSTTEESGSHGDITESLVGAIRNAYYDFKSQFDPLSSFTSENYLDNKETSEWSIMEEDLDLLNLKGIKLSL